MDIWYPPLFETSSLGYQAKLILRRTENVEQQFGNFCQDFAHYAHDVAGVRDAGDRLTRRLHKYKESLKDSPGTRKTLEQFIVVFNSIQDQEEARVKRLQAKVVAGFSKYGMLCRAIKDEIQMSLEVSEREHHQAEKFSKLQSKLIGNYHLHQQRQEELDVAIKNTHHAQSHLNEAADKFEQQKVGDLKQVLMNFCEIELDYHARVIALYTSLFDIAKEVGPQTDVEHFKKSIVVQSTSKNQVGLDAVPVFVRSLVKTDGTPSEPISLVSHTARQKHTSDEDGITTDTKEFAVTTMDEDSRSELISEVTYRTPNTTDDESSTGRSASNNTKSTPVRKAAPDGPAKKLRVSIVEAFYERKEKDGRARAIPLDPKTPLTPTQINRYSNHFGVPAHEYKESDHALTNSLGSSPT